MDNFYWPPWQDVVTNSYNDSTSYAMVAVSDIGDAAAKAFENPEQFVGKTIELAGDSLTLEQTKKVWMELVGKPLGGGPMPEIPKPLADTMKASRCLRFGSKSPSLAVLTEHHAVLRHSSPCKCF